MTILDRRQTMPIDPIERRVREMDAVRSFVTKMVVPGDDRSAFELTDQQWETLCRHARGMDSEESAVAEVVLQAYRLQSVPHVDAAPNQTASSVSGASTDQRPQSPDPSLPSVVATAAPIPTLDSPTPPGLILDAPVAAATTLVVPDAAGTGPTLGIASALVTVSGVSAGPGEVSPMGRPGIDFDPWAADYEPPSIALPIPEDFGRPGTLIGEPTSPTSSHRARRKRHAKTKMRRLDDGRRERWLTLASWVRNLGVIVLLFVAWQLWGTAIAQHHSQTALKSQFETKVHTGDIAPTKTFSLVPATTRIADPPPGTVMAQLQIPKIALDQFVVSGTGENQLAKGPGHYLGTAMPGQAGNVAIAGHRTTHGAPFNRLADLAIGDPIYLTTTSGQRLTYIVSAKPVPVSPTDVTVLNNFGDDRLTLTTCNPEFSARQRLIVVAAYLPPGAAHPSAMAAGKGTPYALGPSASSGWNMSAVPLVLLFGAALVALGLLWRRLSGVYGREGRWLILVPIAVALLLVLFETLTNFLPTSV